MYILHGKILFPDDPSSRTHLISCFLYGLRCSCEFTQPALNLLATKVWYIPTETIALKLTDFPGNGDAQASVPEDES